MTVHGIVIGFLLLFPWVLVGVVMVGATASVVKRSLAHLQEAWRIGGRRRAVPFSPQGRRREMTTGSPPARDSSVPQQDSSMRKAA